MNATESTIHQSTETLTPEEPGMALDTPDNATKIAELAYYKAERRGFEPGHELEDWLEAERELTPTIESANPR